MPVLIVSLFLVIAFQGFLLKSYWKLLKVQNEEVLRRLKHLQFRTSTVEINTDLILRILESQVNPVPVASGIFFYALVDGELKKVDEMALKVTQQQALSLKIQDAKGNDAKVDGAPQWSLSDSTLATLEVAADGLSALIKPLGPLGLVKVQVHADADLGEGVKDLLGELDVEILAGDAAVIAIVAGAAEDQPAPAPEQPPVEG